MEELAEAVLVALIKFNLEELLLQHKVEQMDLEQVEVLLATKTVKEHQLLELVVQV
jgi:hypothetical protein